VTPDAIGDFCNADDAAGFKLLRQVGDAVFPFDIGERFGVRVGFAFAGVDQDGAAQVGGPNPVFNILVAVDDEPGPRLPDGNGLQLFESRRPAGGFLALSLHTGKTFITSSPR